MDAYVGDVDEVLDDARALVCILLVENCASYPERNLRAGVSAMVG